MSEKADPVPKDETAPKEEEAASKQETSEDIPEHLRGKNLTELAKMVQEKDQYLGSRDQELGTLRKQVGELQNYLAYLQGQVQQSGQKQANQPGGPSDSEDEFDFDKPAKSVLEIARREAKREAAELRKQIQTELARTRVQEVLYSFESGKKAAYSSNPKLFKGIEKDVEVALQQAYKEGKLSKDALGDPDIWVQAGRLGRLLRNETEFLVPEKKKPVRATQTEVPGATGSDVFGEQSAELSPLVQKMMQRLPEEKRKQVLEKTLAERRGRA